jgi:exodeoxyribonuclease VII large subunit
MALDSLRRGALQRDGERLLREPSMRLDNARNRLVAAMETSLESAAARLNQARATHRAHHPARVLQRRIEHLAHIRTRLTRGGTQLISMRNEQLARLRGMLRALGPESAFQRGFSITMGEDGKIIRSAASLRPGMRIHTRLADGRVASRVVPDDEPL